MQVNHYGFEKLKESDIYDIFYVFDLINKKNNSSVFEDFVDEFYKNREEEKEDSIYYDVSRLEEELINFKNYEGIKENTKLQESIDYLFNSNFKNEILSSFSLKPLDNVLTNINYYYSQAKGININSMINDFNYETFPTTEEGLFLSCMFSILSTQQKHNIHLRHYNNIKKYSSPELIVKYKDDVKKLLKNNGVFKDMHIINLGLWWNTTFLPNIIVKDMENRKNNPSKFWEYNQVRYRLELIDGLLLDELNKEPFYEKIDKLMKWEKKTITLPSNKIKIIYKQVIESKKKENLVKILKLFEDYYSNKDSKFNFIFKKKSKNFKFNKEELENYELNFKKYYFNDVKEINFDLNDFDFDNDFVKLRKIYSSDITNKLDINKLYKKEVISRLLNYKVDYEKKCKDIIIKKRQILPDDVIVKDFDMVLLMSRKLTNKRTKKKLGVPGIGFKCANMVLNDSRYYNGLIVIDTHIVDILNKNGYARTHGVIDPIRGITKPEVYKKASKYVLEKINTLPAVKEKRLTSTEVRFLIWYYKSHKSII